MSKLVHWVEIDRLVKAHHREDPTSSLEALERYLRKWWCLTYERPFKDPLLEQYTLDELAYEFLTKHYLKPENDPDKVDTVHQMAQEDEEWAAKMVQEELRKMEASANRLATNLDKATEKLTKPSEKTPEPLKSKKKSKKPRKVKVGDQEIPDIISTKFNVPDPSDN